MNENLVPPNKKLPAIVYFLIISEHKIYGFDHLITLPNNQNLSLAVSQWEVIVSLFLYSTRVI